MISDVCGVLIYLLRDMSHLVLSPAHLFSLLYYLYRLVLCECLHLLLLLVYVYQNVYRPEAIVFVRGLYILIFVFVFLSFCYHICTVSNFNIPHT